MPEFIDLHSENAALKEKELALGFARVYSPAVVELKTQKDLMRVQEFVAVESVDGELLRKAVRRASVLVNPLFVKNFGRDDGLIRAVAESNNVFEIPLRALLEASFVSRAKLFSEVHAFLQKCVKLRARFAFVSRARTEFDLKAPEEIISVGLALGLSREQARFALSETPKDFLAGLTEAGGLE